MSALSTQPETWRRKVLINMCSLLSCSGCAMNKTATAKLLGLPSERDLPTGFMGGMLQFLDLNQALAAKHKLLADRRYGDGLPASQADFFSASGMEAPRNSVDYSVAETPRTSTAQLDFFSGLEAPRNSHANQEDIPVASFIPTKLNFPGTVAHADFLSGLEAPRNSHANQDDIPVAAFIPNKLEFPRSIAQADFLSGLEAPRNSHANQEDVAAASFIPSRLNFQGSIPQADFFSGLEAPRNSVDYSVCDTPRTSHARQDDVPFGYEFPKNPLVSPPPGKFFNPGIARRDGAVEKDSRRIAAVPVPKMPVAGDPVAEFESRRRAPGVVARLMGLEALPEAKQLRKDPIMAESEMQPPRKSSAEGSAPQRLKKSVKDSVQHRRGPDLAPVQQALKSQPPSPKAPSETSYSPKKPQEIRILYPKQFPSPEGSPMRESPRLRNLEIPESVHDKSRFEQLAFRDHPQEKQLQEFKKQFEAKIQPKDKTRANQLEGSDKEFEDKKILVRERLNEAKKTLGREKLSEAKRRAARQKLKESKEFLEALEFLQSNREFFLRFLQEPLSSLAKQMQEPESPQKLYKADRKQPRNPSLHGEPKRDGLSARSPVSVFDDERKNREAKLLFQRQQGPKTLADLAMFSRTRASSDGELGQHHGRRGSPGATDVESGLTRIVILKPTLGKGSPLRSISPSSSPRPYRSGVDRKDNTRQGAKDILRDARNGGGQNFHDGGGALSGEEARFRGTQKDPRVIAREIVRKAQETASKKLGREAPRAGSPSVTKYGSTGKRVSVSRAGTDSGEITASSDGDGSLTPSRLKPYRDSPGRSASSSPRMRSLDVAANSASRDVKKRVPERIKILQPEKALEEPQPKAMSPLGRNAALVNMSKPGSPQPASPVKARELSRHVAESLIENQSFSVSDAYVSADEKRSGKPSRSEKVFKMDKMSNPPQKSTEEGKDESLRVLTRSRSLPNSVSADWTHPDTKVRKPGSMSVGQTTDVPERSRPVKQSDSPRIRPLASKADSIVGHSQESGGEGTPTSSEVSTHKLNLQEAANRMEGAKDHAKRTEEVVLDAVPPVNPITCELRTSEMSDASQACVNPVSDAHGPEPTGQVQFQEPSQKVVEISNGCEAKVVQEAQEIWSLSPDGLDNADGASEASVEKGGQPSPVSILDSPFEQESPQSPPADFKEVASDLQELRLRLQLLKLDGIERPRDDLGDQDQSAPSSGVLNTRLATEEADRISTEADSISSQLSRLDEDAYSISSLKCPKGREADMAYVRDLLVASGFAVGTAAAMYRWFSPSRPLDVCLFDKLEDFYCSSQATKRSARKASTLPEEEQQQIDTMNRRILFEVVNEVLLKKLGPYLNQLPWAKSPKLALRSIPTEKQLVQETWDEICTFHMPIEGPNYTLENMVERDLKRGRQWMAFQEEAEQVGIELEGQILGDLIEEAIQDLLSRQSPIKRI